MKVLLKLHATTKFFYQKRTKKFFKPDFVLPTADDDSFLKFFYIGGKYNLLILDIVLILKVNNTNGK